MLNYRDTIISQYANSPTLLAILSAINDAIDPSANLENFYDQIWNIDTATGYGLDVWGRIVAVERNLTLIQTYQCFGFYTGGTPDFAPWGQAPFLNSGTTSTNFSLTDDVYRRLILVKAAANISYGTIPVINALLTTYFGSGKTCFVRDDGGMAASYIFEFALQPVDIAILTVSGAVPRPCGVAVTLRTGPPGGPYTPVLT